MQIKRLQSKSIYFTCFFARLPFGWKTLIGYSAYLTVETLSVVAIVTSILPVACLAVGSYLLLSTVIKVITNDFYVLCDKISIGSNKEMKELFCNMIADMSEVKELSFFFKMEELFYKELILFNNFN